MSKTHIAKTTVILFVIIVGILILSNYFGKEGYNPSDDGAIIGQSYRLLNGAIAHKDFISIRPVFSGILHSISFYSPFSLEISSRIFTFFEYFVYSFLWIIILFRTFKLKFINEIYSLIFFTGFSLISLFLNINHYTIFPCTTTDAIFLCLLGFFFILKVFKENYNIWNMLIVGLGLFMFSLSALTRQNFLLLTILAFAFISYQYYKIKKIKDLLIILSIGVSPFIIYTIYLNRNDCFGLFIEQMTGRTELFETGIYTFGKSFIKSGLLILNLGIISTIIYAYFFKKHLLEKFRNNKKIIFIILTIYSLFTIFYSYKIIIENTENMFNTAFELFWILVVLVFSFLIMFRMTIKQRIVMLFPIALAWTSSISLGDNSPVFVIGIMSTTCLYLAYTLIFLSKVMLRFRLSEKIKYIIFSSMVLIFIVLSFIFQRKYNYRDLESSRLEYNLGIHISGLNNVYSNENCNFYFQEISVIYTKLNAKDKFVVLPNNPGIYALLETKNPFPLDWMQPAEYIGSENYLTSKLEEILASKDLYILIDKYNSKNIATSLSELDLSQYKYIEQILKNSEKLEIESKYFNVYKTPKLVKF